jgi:hypothetical protein
MQRPEKQPKANSKQKSGTTKLVPNHKREFERLLNLAAKEKSPDN